MQELLLKLFFALLPIPFFFLIYYNYFKKDTLWSEHLEAFLYGILFASFLVFIKIYFKDFFNASSPYFRGFAGAAVPEKLGAFILIYIFLNQRKNTLTVLQGTVMSMMFGLGFAAFENIVYASASSSIILVRLISAVPLHVYSNGILGYLLSVSLLCAPSLQKRKYKFLSLTVPVLLHGIFDTALFTGGFSTFYIAPIIVFMNSLVVYFLARAQSMPGMRWLLKNQIQYSDWKALEKEPQYERWILRSSGIKISEKVAFILWHISVRNIFVIAVTGALYFGLNPFREFIYSLLIENLSAEEFWTLIIGLPVSYLISILTSGMVNPEYFKSSIIKIPIIANVEIYAKKAKYAAITYDITDSNSLLKTVDALPTGEEVRLVFSFDRYRSPEIQGNVIWDSHYVTNSSSGTIVRFETIPPGFRKFLFRYYLFKISRGLSYNLRLPGFEGIRKFFLSPLSLMQKEKRYPAGTVLFKEGDTGNEFYYIKKGKVDIIKSIGNQETVVLNRLGPGDIFGEMAIAGKQKRAAGAVCRTNCLIAVSDGDNLEALIKGNPEFTHKIIQELARRIFHSESVMKNELNDAKSDIIYLEKTMEMILLAFLYEQKLLKITAKGISISRKKISLALFKKFSISFPDLNLKNVLLQSEGIRQFAEEFSNSPENTIGMEHLIRDLKLHQQKK